MKVGLFLDDHFPDSGGLARSVQAQAEALQELGHTVFVFCPKGSKKLSYVCPLPVLRLPRSLTPEGSLRWSSSIAEDIAKKYKLDIVHSHSQRGALILADRVARITGVPHVNSFHAFYPGVHDFYPITGMFLSIGTNSFVRYFTNGIPDLQAPKSLVNYFKPNQPLQRLDWLNFARIANKVDCFVTPMPHMLKGLQQLAPDVKGVCIPTGIKPELFQTIKRQRAEDQTRFRFISISRLAKEKRTTHILRAFLQAADKNPNIELQIVGKGPEQEKLNRIIKDSPHADRIIMSGHLDNREALVQELVNADAFILASYHFDTQGLALLEAAAAGLPVVYCDERLNIGVSPQNSILTNPDEDSLAEAMIKLATNPQLIQRMSLASLDAVRDLTVQGIGKRYIDLYQDLIGTAAKKI